MSNVPNSELQTRIENISRMVKGSGNDAILIPLGVNFYYAFGKIGSPSERLTCGIISDQSDPFILTPEFEITNIGQNTFIDQIIGWEETQSPYKILAEELYERGIDDLMVDPKFWFGEADKLLNAGKLNIHSAGNSLISIRSIKSDWEIEQQRKAAEISSNGIINTLMELEEGITEKEVKNQLRDEFIKLGGDGISFAAVQFGENSAIPHGKPTDKRLKRNEVVLIDAGTSINGYHGDITISYPFGNPDGFEEIYEIVYEANREALESDKEGIIPSKLDHIARSKIDDAGYGQYFTHRLGHGLGLEVHEEPYIVGDNNIPLQPNNTHTIEPGIYRQGEFGIRIEDDVLVKSSGAELLFDTPRYIFD